MAEISALEFTPGQMAVLEKLMSAGYKFITLEHLARHLAVEKQGFVAMLDPAGGKLNVWGQVGYRMGEGVGMLVERQGKRVFVRHQEALEVTPELLAAYERFKEDLQSLLSGTSQSTG